MLDCSLFVGSAVPLWLDCRLRPCLEMVRSRRRGVRVKRVASRAWRPSECSERRAWSPIGLGGIVAARSGISCSISVALLGTGRCPTSAGVTGP